MLASSEQVELQLVELGFERLLPRDLVDTIVEALTGLLDHAVA